MRWGEFHIRGIADDGAWDTGRLKYRREGQIEIDLASAADDRKIKTVVELLATMMEAMASRATTNMWIHESLEGEAKSFWERFSNNHPSRLCYQLN